MFGRAMNVFSVLVSLPMIAMCPQPRHAFDVQLARRNQGSKRSSSSPSTEPVRFRRVGMPRPTLAPAAETLPSFLC